MSDDKHKVRPDQVTVWKDRAGEFRWTRRNAFNKKITGDSGEGYDDEDHAVEMAYRVNGGDFIVYNEKGEVVPKPDGI